MKKKVREIIENLGWRINSDTSIEIWTDTAGQDVCIECNKPNELKDTIRCRYENYDIDEEVEMYLNASRNGLKGVPSARVLVKDCEEVERLLGDLWDAVRELEF